ncbi:MAG TPA: DUF2141 domain-containing protein [Burkholderiales bacterium]|nr:DUF2141 domain-containing protein [Burkholderiales bacterium]
MFSRLNSRSCSQLAGLAALCVLLAGGAAAADLQVEVRNVKPRKGEVRAALFDSAEAFASAVKIRAVVSEGEIVTGVFAREGDFLKDPVDTVVVPVQGRTAILRFTDLEPGEYALGLFQDLNGDERLDITLGGLSLEPWGVSNNKANLHEDPLWEDAKFTLPPEGLSMVVHLLHERPGDR